MHSEGYSLVHFSDGYIFSKRAWEVRQGYFIDRRNENSCLSPGSIRKSSWHHLGIRRSLKFRFASYTDSRNAERKI